jgi:hypothetical protein
MPAQSNGLLQFRYCSSSAYEDDGKWIKVIKAVITNDRVIMVGKRSLGCIFKERERERLIASDDRD